MTAIAWSKAWELGVDAMDDTHREFVGAINALHEAADDALLERLDELIRHTARHFSTENDWMAMLPFPPMHCHVAEHHGVLEAMRLARVYMAEGKLAVGRVLCRELDAWFANHARTMDAMLASVIKLTGFDPADPRHVLAPPGPAGGASGHDGEAPGGHTAPCGNHSAAGSPLHSPAG